MIEKLPPRRIPTVGIVTKSTVDPNITNPQTHHHHSGAVCPSYGMVSLDTPDRTRATSLEGVGQECFGLD
jgi:hypothetical protein